MKLRQVIPWLSVPFLVIASLSGCSDRVKDEQERLEMVRKGGSVEEVCRQSRKVADAALAAKDEQYDVLDSTADIDCMTAELNPGSSYDQATNSSATPIEADNMDAMADTVTLPKGNDIELDP